MPPARARAKAACTSSTFARPPRRGAAGCFSLDGYTHETQCVIYAGPDTFYRDREICFNSNEDTLTIVDATDKLEQVQLSRTGYGGSAYTHQGWLTEDQRFFLVNDEGDEIAFKHPTRTWIWDVSDLDAPVLVEPLRRRHPVHRSQPLHSWASRLRVELPQRPARARRERPRSRARCARSGSSTSIRQTTRRPTTAPGRRIRSSQADRSPSTASSRVSSSSGPARCREVSRPASSSPSRDPATPRPPTRTGRSS